MGNIRWDDNVNTAFAVLLEELKIALQRTNDEGAKAFAQGNYYQVDHIKDQGERIRALISRAEVLASEWANLQKEAQTGVAITHSLLKEGTSTRGTHRIGRVSQRAPRGARTPERAYYRSILSALVEMGGRGPAGEVLQRVWDQMHHRLNEFDLGRLKSGEVRWRNAACWARQNMIEEGLLSDHSPIGIWEITPKGREFLKRLLEEEST